MNKKEVHKIAPILGKISHKNHGFNVPSSYFNTIEDSVLAEIKASKLNLNKITYKTPDAYFNTIEDLVITKLKSQSLQKVTTNSIPEGYFEKLEDQVLNKIKDTSKVRTLKNISKYVAPIAIAASFLIVFLLNNNTNTITFENLATSEIEEFIESGALNYDAESLATIFPEVTLEGTSYITTLSDTDVINYLNENDLEGLLLEN
jgi:Glu-tRNA(Gln) amidotransferase subunit E-like FAD-binding protein